ncbi:MAG: MmgE/PrpD family protein, partial [Dehalococcoidia bacterium]|nr:MmgE/PrpD family protein [Dehalococcoidia bacterium]
MDEYTRKLATFAASLDFVDLPSGVIDNAKLCLLDTLGCGLFGSTLPWSQILANCVVDIEGGSGCTLWGLSAKASPTGAALVNGSMVHGFELDDLHKQSIVHPGSVTATAALAVAERLGSISGKRFLTAMVAGYEVAARVGMCLGTAHLLQGWHPTGTHGTLAAAAAAGSVLGLAPDLMQQAFGIAGTQASGLMSSQYSSMVKRFHAGRAAQSGVYAAFLARRGYTGITGLFEYEYGGYCTTFSPSFDREKLIAGLGETWEINTVGFKPYSTNGSCHTAIDALVELRNLYGLRPDDIEAVRVFTSSATFEHVGWPYAPDSVTTAQMNLPYIAAVTIATGEAFVDQFTEERIRDGELVALAGRVAVIVDPDMDARGPAQRHYIRLEVKLKDGRLLEASRLSARGSADFPLTREEVEQKFERLAGKV